MRKLLTAVAVVAGAAVSLTAPAGAEGPAWGPCPFPGRVECTTVSVPVDYRDPSGDRIDIHVSRVRSERPDLRRGNLPVAATRR